MTGPRRNRPEPVDRDVYRSERKAPAGTFCPECRLVVRSGRWTRPAAGEEPGGPSRLCPACCRTRDRAPAGSIVLQGDLGPRRTDLTNLVRAVEDVESAEHPLERLMSFEVDEAGMRVQTTGVHLARRIVSAIERQLHLEFDVRFGEEELLLRATGRLPS